MLSEKPLMQLTYKIALCPSIEHETSCRRTAGRARFVWSLAHAIRNQACAASRQPHAVALKRASDATENTRCSWMTSIHRDAHTHRTLETGQLHEGSQALWGGLVGGSSVGLMGLVL